MPPKTYTFPIRTVSEANHHEHWVTRNRRKKAQRDAMTPLWRSFRPVVTVPARITFTRHAAGHLDDDNLRGAFKAVRDVIAKEIGIDDGSPFIEWRYAQVKAKRGENFFTVEVENL